MSLGPGLRIQKSRSWRTRLWPTDAAVLSGAIPAAFTTADLRAYVIAVASNRALRTGETIRPEHCEAARERASGDRYYLTSRPQPGLSKTVVDCRRARTANSRCRGK